MRRTAILPAAIVAVSCAAPAPDSRPNVVLFLADDQGWGDLSVHGNGNVRTPNLDALAREGASFTRFFVSPVCSPTRAELLTGRYHPRSGVYATSRGGQRLVGVDGLAVVYGSRRGFVVIVIAVCIDALNRLPSGADAVLGGEVPLMGLAGEDHALELGVGQQPLGHHLLRQHRPV